MAPAVNQIELHPFCQQRPIVEYCREHGIFVQAFCPLVRGKFDDPVLQEVARKYNKEVSQVLVRWSLQHGCVSAIPPLTTGKRLEESADARGLTQVLPAAEVIETGAHRVQRGCVRLRHIGGGYGEDRRIGQRSGRRDELESC